MRTVPYVEVVAAARGLCLRAAVALPADVVAALERAHADEASPRAREILGQCLENARVAADGELPICQDTGVAVFFVERGEEVHIAGGDLVAALTEGTRRGYVDGHLRKSMVAEPVFARDNTGDNTPPLIHVETGPGEQLRLSLLPKGGGCENMSALGMLEPGAGPDGVRDFVVRSVVEAGGMPCPPTIVGVGIGGSADHAALLAKRALLRQVGEPHPDPRYAGLERTIHARINESGVGPQGLGGTTTVLAVHAEYAPCHIASLPVAVNLNCHAARRASVEV